MILRFGNVICSPWLEVPLRCLSKIVLQLNHSEWERICVSAATSSRDLLSKKVSILTQPLCDSQPPLFFLHVYPVTALSLSLSLSLSILPGSSDEDPEGGGPSWANYFSFEPSFGLTKILNYPLSVTVCSFFFFASVLYKKGKTPKL